MKVYVLIAMCQYDHGVQGVFSTEQAARDWAADLWPETDGHHYFRIDVLTLDERPEPTFQMQWHESDPRDPRREMPEIEVIER